MDTFLLIIFIFFIFGLALANLWGVGWLLKRLSLSPRCKKLFFVVASTVVVSPMPTLWPNGVLLLPFRYFDWHWYMYMSIWKFALPSFLLTALASAFVAQKIFKGPEPTVFAFDGFGGVDPDARPHFLMRGFPILMTVLIALIAIGIGPDLWRSWSPRWAKGEAALRYQAECQQWLAADHDVLLRELVAFRGEVFSTRPRSKVLGADVLLPDTVDPTLAALLNQPQWMAALDLERPRKLLPNVDIRALIGDRRCPDSDKQLIAESIEPGSVPSRSNSGPRVACQSLLNALVLREGTQYGDWLFLLPDSRECPWLYLMNRHDAQCAASLKSWLAASVVGAKSRRPGLLWGEPELVKELHAQPRMGLKEGIAELCAAGSWNRRCAASPDLSGIEPQAAIGDYEDALRELGDARPAMVLAASQTHKRKRERGYYPALVRLWNGTAFSTLRLRLQDHERAVVVVKNESFDGVVQISGDGKTIYLDPGASRAFVRFKDWVDHARAEKRVRKRVSERGPDPARFPIG